MVAAPAEATDDQLVVAAQQGSDAAFDALVSPVQDSIAAYVRGIVSDHARAEDIVQDVFMSALRSLRATERDVAFKPWVYEIAKNACIDHLRRSRRTSEVSIDSEDFSPGDEGRLFRDRASTDAAYSTREDLDVLKMAFSDLPRHSARCSSAASWRDSPTTRSRAAQASRAPRWRACSSAPGGPSRTGSTISLPASAASACRQ